MAGSRGRRRRLLLLAAACHTAAGLPCGSGAGGSSGLIRAVRYSPDRCPSMTETDSIQMAVTGALDTADLMASEGLVAAGFDLLLIDACPAVVHPSQRVSMVSYAVSHGVTLVFAQPEPKPLRARELDRAIHPRPEDVACIARTLSVESGSGGWNDPALQLALDPRRPSVLAELRWRASFACMHRSPIVLTLPRSAGAAARRPGMRAAALSVLTSRVAAAIAAAPTNASSPVAAARRPARIPTGAVGLQAFVRIFDEGLAERPSPRPVLRASAALMKLGRHAAARLGRQGGPPRSARPPSGALLLLNANRMPTRPRLAWEALRPLAYPELWAVDAWANASAGGTRAAAGGRDASGRLSSASAAAPSAPSSRTLGVVKLTEMLRDHHVPPDDATLLLLFGSEADAIAFASPSGGGGGGAPGEGAGEASRGRRPPDGYSEPLPGSRAGNSAIGGGAREGGATADAHGLPTGSHDSRGRPSHAGDAASRGEAWWQQPRSAARARDGGSAKGSSRTLQVILGVGIGGCLAYCLREAVRRKRSAGRYLPELSLVPFSRRRSRYSDDLEHSSPMPGPVSHHPGGDADGVGTESKRKGRGRNQRPRLPTDWAPPPVPTLPPSTINPAINLLPAAYRHTSPPPRIPSPPPCRGRRGHAGSPVPGHAEGAFVPACAPSASYELLPSTPPSTANRRGFAYNTSWHTNLGMATGQNEEYSPRSAAAQQYSPTSGGPHTPRSAAAAEGDLLHHHLEAMGVLRNV